MKRTPTTPDAGVDERLNRVGQKRPSGSAEKRISAEHIAGGGYDSEPGIDGTWPSGAEEDLVGFFRLLLEIDRRINPDLYDESIRDVKCNDDEARHITKTDIA